MVDHGRVIAEGTPAELKADLGTSVVAVTLSDHESAQKAAALVASLSGHPPLVDKNIVELTVENGPKVGAEVLRTLDAAGIPIAGLALREPSLDDVFLSLTGHKSEAETDEQRAARTGRGPKRPPDEAETDGRDAA